MSAALVASGVQQGRRTRGNQQMTTKDSPNTLQDSNLSLRSIAVKLDPGVGVKVREAVHEMNHGRLPVNCWDWPEADCMRFPKRRSTKQ
jgi:hypothetical protein